jgi:hypothetical protein
MKLIHCSLTVLALAVPSIIAQNLTDIVGTWSSGAQAVVTGAVSFCRFDHIHEAPVLITAFGSIGLCQSGKYDFQPS